MSRREREERRLNKEEGRGSRRERKKEMLVEIVVQI